MWKLLVLSLMCSCVCFISEIMYLLWLQIFEWWHIQPDWFKTFWVICGSCIVVFSAYRLAMLSAETYPAFLNFMEKYCVTKGKPGEKVKPVTF